ncbi:gp53-like domain-containing protein [Escherichia sp. Lx600-2]|uniref:gp53-like domain-containing protein n=1 Tax=Escherichia sp. Lx600-2 TaxID=2994672 RepID=UPI003FA55EC8
MSKPTGKLIRVTAASIGAVPVGRKVNNKPLSADISLSAGDVGAYGKTETDNKVADAKKAGTDAQTKANAASTAATNANNNANGRVPNGRKVNGKPLTSDITLSAGDVGTYTKEEIDKKIIASGGKNTASKLANGWWKCGDTGLIYQWGIATHAKKTMFPIAFPTMCAQIVLGCNGSTGSSGYYYKTNISFEVNTGGGGSTSTSYIAIGY